jgi:uncharacterized protein (DUF1800 family)
MAIPKVTPSEVEYDAARKRGKLPAEKHAQKHKKHHKRHHKKKHRRHHRKTHHAVVVPNPAPAPAPSAAAIAATQAGESRPPGSYGGTFGVPQANRLLTRAGVGPRPGQANELVSMGLTAAVQSLTRPSGKAVLSGPAPTVENEHGEPEPLAPADLWGHDHLWWLDRMVRTNQPLVERMALVFHDWFATSQASTTAQQMIDQSNLFRADCFGSFLDLFKAVTIDPAMLQWLNGGENVKGAPNENYGREMMELFSLGADRGAYTEDDIREQARALTGWTFEWSETLGQNVNFHFDPDRHDDEDKTVFGHTGNWDWEDACRLCVENPFHPSFFVEKLWSYFVPTAPSASRREQLISTYTSSGMQIRPVLEEILLSAEFYEGQPMVKPPVVHLATMMRALGRYVDTYDFVWLCEQSGQQLFWPPNVSGWDDAHWLDTSRMRARWNLVSDVLDGTSDYPWDPYSSTETPEEAVGRAVASWGDPELRAEHRAELLSFAQRVESLPSYDGQESTYNAMRQNALLQLIGISPDLVLQ